MTSLVGRSHVSDAADRGRLARDLTRAVKGEVRFDRGAQAAYANDASIYRQVPIGVVIPRHDRAASCGEGMGPAAGRRGV